MKVKVARTQRGLEIEIEWTDSKKPEWGEGCKEGQRAEGNESRCNWQFVNKVPFPFPPTSFNPFACKSYASKASENMKTCRLFLLYTRFIISTLIF